MDLLLSGLVGAGVGALIGAAVSLKVQNRVDQADRRRQAASILGDLRAFIDNLAPVQWIVGASGEEARLHPQELRWQQLRAPALSLHALYPDFHSEIEEMYTSIDNLLVEIRRAIAQSREEPTDELLPPGERWWQGVAEETQGRVRQLVNELMDHVGRA